MYKFEDIIEEVNELNTDLRFGLDDIVGVTIEKGLIPTIANLTQTALDKFYIIKPETFVYNPRTHGVRLGMGYNDTNNTYITSWNNVAFRVKETARSIVIPQYLWLCFCRPSWDRLTNFLAWGSSTIVFAWREFLNISITLPTIEEQQEIVSEYETLSNRIRLNEQMIAKLEETAQALYRKMFVDGIDKENLPEGWRMGTLGEVAFFKYGKLADKHTKSVEFPYPVFSGYAVTGYTNEYTLEEPTIVIVARGDAGTGKICMSPPRCFLSNLAISIETKERSIKEYLYYYLLNSDTMSLRSGSAQAQITINNVEPFEIVLPTIEICVDFSHRVKTLYNNIILYKQETEKLIELQSLLLARMGK